MINELLKAKKSKVQILAKNNIPARLVYVENECMVCYRFVCPFPEHRQDVDSADGRRQERGDGLDVVEQLRHVLYDRNPGDGDTDQHQDTQSMYRHIDR